MANNIPSKADPVSMGFGQAAAKRPRRGAGAGEDLPANVRAMTGKLYRGENDGEVRGWLFDHRTGARVEFTGVRDPRANGGYLLIGKVLRV